MINVKLIWDKNEDYVNRLALQLGISNHADAVFSFNDLKQKSNIANKDAVILLLETNIDGQKRSDFFGIEIIRYLRKELRYKGVIIVYSTYDESHIRGIKDASILFTSAIRLKKFTEETFDANEIERLINDIPRLSNELLDDIIFSKFDLKGKIHEHLHNLKTDLTVKFDAGSTLESVLETQTTILEKYRELLQREIDREKIPDFQRYYESTIAELFSDIKKEWNENKPGNKFTYANAGAAIAKYANQVLSLAPVSGDDIETTAVTKANWEVLFLDDSKSIRETVFEFFKTRNVVCHLASNEEEVYRKLKEHSPKISLFLTDIRLFDENQHWCDRQGYDVMTRVNSENEYPLVYAVLTSKKGTISKMVQKRRVYQTLWFVKEDVINNEHSFNIFFDIIKKYAEENFNSNTVFQPKIGSWKTPYKGVYLFPLKMYHKYHQESHDYLSEEMIINKRAVEFAEGNGARQEWMSKLTKKEIAADIQKFRETKLLARRIILMLAAEGYTTKPVSIFNFLTGHDEKEIEKVKTFYSKLGMSTKIEEMVDVARAYYKGEAISEMNILYEEYQFLKNNFFEEECNDLLGIGSEKENLSSFLVQIEKIFSHDNVPASLKKIMPVIEKNGVPKLEKLDALFAELKTMDEQSGYKLLQPLEKHKFLTSVRNELIRDLLIKYEWI